MAGSTDQQSSSGKESAASTTDFYSELTLDRQFPTAEIRDDLEFQRAGKAAQSLLPGPRGDTARAQVDLIDRALAVFHDDATRAAYDRALTGVPDAPAGVDWLSRAWSYYRQGDWGPAEIAARKARNQDKDNPETYVVSAWIEFAPVTRHPLVSDESREAVIARFREQNPSAKHDPVQAVNTLVENVKRYVDEAYALDENSTAVLHLRGVCFYFLGDFQRATQSLQSALDTTTDDMEAAEICLRIALVAEELGDWETMESMSSTLEVPSEGGEGIIAALLSVRSRALAAQRAVIIVQRDTVIAKCEALPLEQRIAAYEQVAQQESEDDPVLTNALRAACSANIERLSSYFRDLRVWRSENKT